MSALSEASHKWQQLKRHAKKKLLPHLTPHVLRQRINTYPPYLGAGIKMQTMDLDRGLCVVTMPLTALNKNVVGTQFGGSLYSMVDPFYMLMLMHQLGEDYVVWDKSAHIDFIAPATSQVTARMSLATGEVATIKDLAKDGEAVFRDYEVSIVDEQQKTVAKVQKTVYIRLRSHSKSGNQSHRLSLS